jgi:hypothetical protein
VGKIIDIQLVFYPKNGFPALNEWLEEVTIIVLIPCPDNGPIKEWQQIIHLVEVIPEAYTQTKSVRLF